MDRLGPAHPGLGADAAHPIREARDEAKVFADMLLADQPNIREVMAAQSDLVTILGQFDPKLVKMSPPGERPED